VPGFFDAMPWGTPTVLEQTRRRCQQLGLHHTEWPAVADIDRPEDLVHCPPGWLQDRPVSRSD
jgi:uncharacterized protein